ncbi:hypothetical protein OAV59_03455 [Flavobacteriaceae bacterium]|nr:hypothetical protein [Flavobacteriaceae bacterium]
MNMNQSKIAILSLGYVGLPLARLFATKYAVVGFDINTESYRNILDGNGFGLSDARSSLEIAHSIRNSEIIPNSNLKHEFLL